MFQRSSRRVYPPYAAGGNLRQSADHTGYHPTIHHAKVILADVTGRNPNVNYELGIAHALKKEVILLTAEAKDVPSDYRHLRYLQYNRMDVDWNQTLSQELQATLKQVLSRLSQSDKTTPSTSPRQSALPNVPAEAEDNANWNPEETRAISKAEALGMQWPNRFPLAGLHGLPRPVGITACVPSQNSMPQSPVC